MADLTSALESKDQKVEKKRRNSFDKMMQLQGNEAASAAAVVASGMHDEANTGQGKSVQKKMDKAGVATVEQSGSGSGGGGGSGCCLVQ